MSTTNPTKFAWSARTLALQEARREASDAEIAAARALLAADPREDNEALFIASARAEVAHRKAINAALDSQHADEREWLARNT